MQSRTKCPTSSSVEGYKTTNGYSTRQSVASVTCDTRAKPSKQILSLRVCLTNKANAFRRISRVRSKWASKASTA